jgi:uncharacterized repeat protein (TIGR01451 family)
VTTNNAGGAPPASCNATKIPNIATAHDTEGDNPSDTGDYTCLPPSISITKNPKGATFNVGQQLSFTIVVSSNGPGTAANVALNDPLPTTGGLMWTVTSVTPSGSCTISPTQSVVCGFGDLGPGQARTVVVTTNNPGGAPPASCTGNKLINIATATANALSPVTDSGDYICTPPLACTNGTIGGIDLGNLQSYLFLFADGRNDANWQGATKGFVGNVAVDGILAKERTSGGVAYAGTISTNDSTLSAWQQIVNQNPGQAFGSTGNVSLISMLKSSLMAAFNQINSLPATPGFTSRSSTSLNGLNTQNGIPETIVINVTSGFQVTSQINITGDPGDVFILRWDTDANPANGYQGTVKFQSGGAIVPHGGLGPGNFINVAGDLDASGGGGTPPPPYPQGPRLDNGTGSLINGGSDFGGGGFFTGYWLTTGDPTNGATHPFSNAIFVGGWYTLTNQFSMTSGTSGVHVCPNPAAFR